MRRVQMRTVKEPPILGFDVFPRAIVCKTPVEFDVSLCARHPQSLLQHTAGMLPPLQHRATQYNESCTRIRVQPPKASLLRFEWRHEKRVAAPLRREGVD